MIDTLLEPFAYGYMTSAILVSSIVGGLCAFLSAYLMLKGWSLIGDALAHSVVPGVAGAYLLGLPFGIGAFLSGGLAASLMLFLNERSGLKTDVVIGIIFTAFFGVGLFVVSLYPMSISIETIIMGNILAISYSDMLQLLIIGSMSLLILFLKWRDLMVVFFDESHARTVGLSPSRLKLVFFTLLSASIVAVKKGYSQIAVGNVIGSNIFNTLGIIGTCAVFSRGSEFLVPESFLIFDVPFMLISTLLFCLLIYINVVLGKKIGVIFITTYFVYIFLNFKLA